MTPRLLLLAAAPLLATATAHAQAPGEMTPTYAPGETAPQVVDPCSYAHTGINPMARRWSVGLSLSSLVVAPVDSYEGSETEFRGAELAVRFRASRRIELFLAFSGGRQYIDDDIQGDLATDSITLGARYRFMPAQKWNWFLMAGLGGTVIAHHESSAEEREYQSRPHGVIGVGLERRFRRFAIQAEARALSIGPREGWMNEPVRGGVETDGGAPPPDWGSITASSDELSGGSFTLGGSFYF